MELVNFSRDVVHVWAQQGLQSKKTGEGLARQGLALHRGTPSSLGTTLHKYVAHFLAAQKIPASYCGRREHRKAEQQVSAGLAAVAPE